MQKKWQSRGYRKLLALDHRLEVGVETVCLPDGREVDDYLQFRTPDFVVVVAETEDGRVICERQYKHGPKRVILTLPAGSVHEGEPPLDAAKRELLEETGYASNDWGLLSSQTVHANAVGCHSHAFLARRCRQVAEPQSGDLEEMKIELLEPQKLLDAHMAGEIGLTPDSAALLPAMLALGVLVYA